jgi:hypothetical protein
MYKLIVAMIACLISFSSLQAVDIFAYLYNDNSKIPVASTETTFGGTLGYAVTSPIFFNSKTSKCITYDDKTGMLTVPKKGYYEVVYSIIPNEQRMPYMSLAVNGNEVLASRIPLTLPTGAASSGETIVRPVTTTTFVLKLKKKDQVSLILPGAHEANIFQGFPPRGDLPVFGHSVSLYIKKI